MGDRPGRCPDCLSEMILLFRFWHCGAKCSDLSYSARQALRRRNAGESAVDLGWDDADYGISGWPFTKNQGNP